MGVGRRVGGAGMRRGRLAEENLQERGVVACFVVVGHGGRVHRGGGEKFKVWVGGVGHVGIGVVAVRVWRTGRVCLRLEGPGSTGMLVVCWYGALIRM